MKVDCPECGGGVGVLSIREGRARCPSCGHEFDAEGRIPRPSSKITGTGASEDNGPASARAPGRPDKVVVPTAPGRADNGVVPTAPGRADNGVVPTAPERAPHDETTLREWVAEDLAPAGRALKRCGLAPEEAGPEEDSGGGEPRESVPSAETPGRTPPAPAGEKRDHAAAPGRADNGVVPTAPGRADNGVVPTAPGPSDSSARLNVVEELGRIGPYEDIREVARGGMGVVYKARNRRLKRTVAIKVLKKDTDDPEELGRFRREAEAAARLQHSNIVPIHAVGEVLGRPYFVMDFIQGRALSELIRSGELSPRSALDVALQVAGALDYAHSQGVIHRDLKPQNVIVDRLRRPQVMDFGLAKQLDEDQTLTRAGTTMGTPAYMPPEQAEGDTSEVDARSDVYAIGAVLYEMLTGTPPFTGSSTMNVLMKVLEEEPTPPRAVNPRIHRDIETICLKAMSKEKSRRYATAREFAEDIRRFLAGEAISAAPTTFAYKMKRWASKNKAAVAAIIAVIGVFCALTGWALGRADRERRFRFAAEQRRLRLTLERAKKSLAEARRSRGRREAGWRDRVRDKLDAAKMDAEYVQRSRPGGPDAARLAEAAGEMKRQLRVDELLEHARYFLEKEQHLAAETFFKIVLEDYDPDNEEAVRGLTLARGVGKLSLVTRPAGVAAALVTAAGDESAGPGPRDRQTDGRRIELGRTPLEVTGVPTGSYRLVLTSRRVGRHEIPVEIARSREIDLGQIGLPEAGEAGDGMLSVPEGAVELPGGRRTRVDAFLVDRYESGARLGEVPRHGMSWVEAAAACAGSGKRLCSLSEWRRACAGPENLAFPYAATFDPERCWTGMTRGPRPAGGRAGCVSPWGVYDMSGNVAEWVGRDESRATTYGGDWSVREGALAGCGSDFYRPPRQPAPRAGFRCCRDAPGRADSTASGRLAAGQAGPRRSPPSSYRGRGRSRSGVPHTSDGEHSEAEDSVRGRAAGADSVVPTAPKSSGR